MKRAAAVFAIIILVAGSLFAQVHIRETIDINPGFKSTSALYDDTTHPVYLGVGGTVTVKLERTYDYGVGLRRAGEEVSGMDLVDVDSSLSLDSLVFENAHQWTKFIFSVDIAMPGGRIVHMYPSYGGWTVIRDGFTHYLYFSINPSTPLEFADVVLSLKLSPNYSLDAIPPPDIYDGIYFVNPFTPRDLTLPTGGEAFLTIDEANPTNQGDDLYMELPSQALLVSNAPGRVGDTIALGRVQCGEPLRLYLRSGKAVVAGMNLYPEISQQGDTPFYFADGSKGTIPVFLPDGRQAQIVGTMWFDDWTDLIYDKMTCTVYVISDTSNVFVQVDPPEVSPGDTATIIVRKHEDCGLTDYPPDQLFNIGISSGSSNGTILSYFWDDTARYFTNVTEGFQFIAADSIDGDSAVVEITVGLPAEEGVPCAVAPGGKVVNNKVAAFQYKSAGSDVRMSLPPNASVMKSLSAGKPSLQAGKKMVSSEVDFTSSKYGIVRETIKKHTILLGETKYYYAVNDPDHADRLIIKDSPTPTNGNTNVVFDDPKIVKGDKLGVYWEYMDAKGNDLKQTKPGSIRLVGRYWEDGKTYKVRLSASAEGRIGSIDIEVKKPARLGSSHQTANDVHGDPFNLDSLIIYNAGKEGVMPQYLKAMVSKETMGYFDPCYRYEAFKDAAELQVKDPKTNDYVYKNLDHSHYRILSANDNGSPDIPSDHSNVRDASCVGTNSGNRINYPGYTTVWDYYWNHTDFYSLNIYSGVKEIENSWENININTARELYGKTPEGLVGIEKQATDDSTNARFFRWAKFDYRGGMQNMVAQTRICGSYGILQLMYYGAEEYPKNKEQYRPEDINDYRVGFEYGVKHLIGKFNLQSILDGHFSDPTWNGGLEAKYKQAVKRYNGRGPAAEDYVNDVISRVPQYKPKP